MKVGKRNSTLFYLLSQYALLNPKAGKQFFKSISETINKKMYPRLENEEIESIINNVIQRREENTLKLYYNEERKILFNPNVLITGKEKMKIVNQVLGNVKSQLTKETIYIALENWDFEGYGAITQKKLVELSGKSIATVKRYWKEFKSYVKDLNNDYKSKNKIIFQESKSIELQSEIHDSYRMTIEQYFENFKKENRSYINYKDVDVWKNIISSKITYVDELTQDAKDACLIAFRYADGTKEEKHILKDL